MSEKEMDTEFDFSGDPSKKEHRWERDKNLRDIWAHLYEWHRNQKSTEKQTTMCTQKGRDQNGKNAGTRNDLQKA